ncbi:thiosulfate oxidation carrier complex protein SoxZ, partial [bacterium]|nr:thiosulfate oxidation carrier complex protein SoxZ [bacterium]
ALLTHPMDNGLSRGDDGMVPAAHFITEVTVRINDERVVRVDTGSGIAADPLFGWRFAGVRPGDRVSVAWRDNQGLEKSAETVVA